MHLPRYFHVHSYEIYSGVQKLCLLLIIKKNVFLHIWLESLAYSEQNVLHVFMNMTIYEVVTVRRSMNYIGRIILYIAVRILFGLHFSACF